MDNTTSTPDSPRPAVSREPSSSSGSSMDRPAASQPQPATCEPHSPRRRDSSRDRQEAPDAGSLEGDSGVSESGEQRATSEPRSELNKLVSEATSSDGNAAPILQNLGARFVEARRLSKPESWRQLQADIMSSLHLLCPYVMPLKDALAACREIEDFIKGSTGQVGKSNEELMADFLRGEGELAKLAAPPVIASLTGAA